MLWKKAGADNAEPRALGWEGSPHSHLADPEGGHIAAEAATCRGALAFLRAAASQVVP